MVFISVLSKFAFFQLVYADLCGLIPWNSNFCLHVFFVLSFIKKPSQVQQWLPKRLQVCVGRGRRRDREEEREEEEAWETQSRSSGGMEQPRAELRSPAGSASAALRTWTDDEQQHARVHLKRTLTEFLSQLCIEKKEKKTKNNKWSHHEHELIIFLLFSFILLTYSLFFDCFDAFRWNFLSIFSMSSFTSYVNIKMKKVWSLDVCDVQVIFL